MCRGISWAMSDMSDSCSAPPALQTSRPPPARKSAAAAIVHPNCPKSCSNGPVSQNCRLIPGPPCDSVALARGGVAGFTRRRTGSRPSRPSPRSSASPRKYGGAKSSTSQRGQKSHLCLTARAGGRRGCGRTAAWRQARTGRASWSRRCRARFRRGCFRSTRLR